MMDSDDTKITIVNAIEGQQNEAPSTQLISETIRGLQLTEIPEYMSFLKGTYSKQLAAGDGRYVLQEIGIRNDEFISLYETHLDSSSVAQLIILSKIKTDQLVDTYLNFSAPTSLVNDFVLDRALKINRRFEGRFKGSLDLIQLGVKLNNAESSEKTLNLFLEIETRYYREYDPAIDTPVFFKLIIPVLNRISSQKGKEAFYEARDKIISEMVKHGITPDQLSIQLLDRRGKNRIRQPTEDQSHEPDFQ